MVAVESWSEWDGTDEPRDSEPAAWLFDAGGSPVVLPAEATGFRVRCLPPGSRGLGELVVDENTGIVLFVPRSTGPTEFASLVGYRPGRYKLAAIDASYQFLRDVPIATFSVTPSMAAAHQAATSSGASGAVAAAGAATGASDALVLELVRALRAAKTETHADPLVLELVSVLRTALTESRVALTESLGVIRAQTADGTRHVSELVRASATVVTAADGAGISRRDPMSVVIPPAPMVPAALPPGDEGAGTGAMNLGDVVSGAISSLAPLLQHLVNTKVFGMSDETSFATIRAMGGAAANANSAPAVSLETIPAASSPGPAAVAMSSIHPSALWPHIAAIERHLTSGEAAVVRRYLVKAPGDQIAQLAREVMSRSAPEAAAWIRSVLTDVSGASDEPASTAAPEDS